MQLTRFAGVGSLCLALPFLGIAVSATPANATSVNASIDFTDGCDWVLTGVPETIELTSADGSKYEGAELQMSYDFADLSLGLTGALNPETATANDSTNCSFYSNIANVKIDFTLTTTEKFSASYGPNVRDPLMDFYLTSSNPLVLTSGDLVACEVPTFSVDYLNKGFSQVDGVGWTLATTSTDKNLRSTAANVRCDLGVSLGIKIPAYEGTPKGAGVGYSFGGPGLIIALSPIGG